MEKGIIFDIKRYAIHDGPGIRQTVFFKGCPLRCWWCHNPESFNSQCEIIYNKNRLAGKELPPNEEKVGYEISVNDLMKEIDKDIIFFDESGGGVTCSGGEPLLQPDFLKALLIQCKEYDIHTALDTSGYASESVLESVMDYVDLFLYDLKIIDSDNHKTYTGLSNKPIINNLKKLIEKNKNIVIRIPIIPDITDTKENICQIKQLLSSLMGVHTIRNEEKVNSQSYIADLGAVSSRQNQVWDVISYPVLSLLPFHQIANEKYKKFKLVNKMQGAVSPSQQSLEKLQADFENCGFKVNIGG